jgi:hypothetical protein
MLANIAPYAAWVALISAGAFLGFRFCWKRMEPGIDRTILSLLYGAMGIAVVVSIVAVIGVSGMVLGFLHP